MKLDELTFNGGSEVTLRKTEVERTSVLRKLAGIYDGEQKLCFLFDCSGSMSERVSASYTNQYVWTDAVIAGIRQQIDSALSKLADPMALIMGLTDEETLTLRMVDPGMAPGSFPAFTADDTELKSRVVK